jgi:multicomponent Na+:H+ antiporter subunit E
MLNVRASQLPREGRSAVLFTRLGLLSVLWAALVEGNTEGLVMGLLVVPLAAWGSLVLEPPGGVRVNPLELLRLLPLCMWLVLRGGLDVARRALLPRVPLSPGRLEVRSRVPRGPARLFLNCVASFMPGTLSVNEDGDTLCLHLLDASPASRAASLTWLRQLEARVVRVFGLPPPPRGLS